MAAFVGGPVMIRTVGGSANINFGGALFMTPKNISKNFLGSAAGHTAVVSIDFTGPSTTNTVDVDFTDQPVVLDN
jgi:spore germination protein PF